MQVVRHRREQNMRDIVSTVMTGLRNPLISFVNDDGSMYVMSGPRPNTINDHYGLGTISLFFPDEGRMVPFAGVPRTKPYVKHYADGPLAEAKFNAPNDMAKGPDGALYVADDETIRVIKDGQVSTLQLDGPISSAEYLRFTDDGKLLLWDEDKLIEITLEDIEGKMNPLGRIGDAPEADQEWDTHCPKQAVDIANNRYCIELWIIIDGALRIFTPEGQFLFGRLVPDGTPVKDGPYDEATFHTAYSVAYDKNKDVLYLTDGESIRKVQFAPRFPESTIPKPVSLWKGYSKGDVETFNGMISSLPVPDPKGRKDTSGNVHMISMKSDFSFCPVCLSYVMRSDSVSECMYMHHVCDPKFRHPDLYKEYATEREGVEWCTVCGRICRGHGHIERNKSSDRGSKRVPYNPGVEMNFFGNDCTPYGGGGIVEKYVRMDALIKAACDTQDEVGKSPDIDVRIKIIENVWNTVYKLEEGLVSAHSIAMKYADKKPLEAPCDLPERSAQETLEEREFPDINRPGDEVHLRPIEHKDPDNVCSVELEQQYEGKPVYQFRHKQSNGSIWEHKNEYVCAEHLMELIDSGVFSGMCPINPAICKARLYPEELINILPADYLHRYRRLFNQKFAAPQAGGGDSEPLMHRIEPTCSLPPPATKKAGRRTSKKAMRKTYRARGRKKTARRSSYRKRR